ncbi:GlcG protein [Robbsia andropogonis]|uniref:GlcG protein n=1 Tax=Robbsia andropogonis TaxID=28092 RepID=A0A0F5JUB9_9BURK|nr:heme-binding protein [Robbsia andropogonis]KKB61245.1 GlcG protein [Robbsia andropogonis]MCP1120881.1 heme-binding protein [Robbsia andropogonis]MCP1130657.1 heme-binding protein [Robbsia andropogonis]
METLSLDIAQKIAAEALVSARNNKFRPMAVVVLDEAGLVKLTYREDGATALRIDIAHGKAAAAWGMGVASRTLLERAKENPAFFNALAATSGGKFVPQTGAIVITSANGTVLGAMGASGGTGDEDEQICIDGVLAAGLSHR